MKQNYDPKKGFKNINELYNDIGSNHVRVNSVKIFRNQVSSGKNDIEEINDEIQKVKVIPIIVNRVQLEKLAHHMKSSGSRQKTDCFQ